MVELIETSLLTMIAVFIFCMIFSPILISLLYRFGIVRHTETDFSTIVGERYEKEGTPIMGGLLVVLTVIIATLILNWNGFTRIPIVIFAISALLGGIDDILNIYGKKRVPRTTQKQLMLMKVHKKWYMRLFYTITLPWTMFINIWFALGSYPGKGLHAGEKMLVQAVSGLFIGIWIFVIRDTGHIWFPWIGNVQIGWIMVPFVMFVVISMTNAVNIADGMDGLASGSILCAFFAYLVIAIIKEDLALTMLNATTIGALIAYLYFNIKPARFQMGDVGSLALGALIASNALMQNRIMILPVICAVFVIEIGSSLIQGVYRRIFGKRLIKMAPLHLHLNLIGWSEEKVVMRFWLFSIISAIVGIWLSLQ